MDMGAHDEATVLRETGSQEATVAVPHSGEVRGARREVHEISTDISMYIVSNYPT
jgi:hypothetical protein